MTDFANPWLVLAALLIDWKFGDPDRLWRRTGHPVAWMGWLIALADRRLNGGAEATRHRNGALALTMLLAVAVGAGLALQWLCRGAGAAGWLAEAAIVSVFLAQHSLRDHVAAVRKALVRDGLAAGRIAVARIVGRDPAQLDIAGVSRAAIESLAENFSDGVVAPVFWYSVFGLPGLLAYKMINTADSMIGHRSEAYRAFGRVAAQVDDLANWVPARLSAVLIALAALSGQGAAAMRRALDAAMRDAGMHRSPNAGWPEASMAGALDVALGGPRLYRDESVAQGYLHAAGRASLSADDIGRALGLFSGACRWLWGAVAAIGVATLG